MVTLKLRRRGGALIWLFAGALPAVCADVYVQTNLTSNIPGMAAFTDPNLIDPWGASFSATSPIWISDRGAGVSTLYNGLGAPSPTASPLVVTVPPGTATTGPTGQVFAGPTTTFTLNGSPANFIFDTLGGTIDAWNGGTTATVVATTPGARYEGLAQANNTLYAANFVAGGAVNVFNSSYIMTGSFNDPNVPAGYAPFNVQNIGGRLYVEYALVNSSIPVPLPGNGGFVDVFNTNGTLVQRLVSGGALDAPWGVALAPASFGQFGGDLLVGNFGNGQINAFDPNTGAFIGTIDGPNGAPFSEPGLWAIFFGNGSQSTSTNALYFAAGINRGNDGLFGDVTAAPEPNTFALMVGSALLVGAWRLRRLRTGGPQ